MQTNSEFPLPLVVAVVGHRDLVPDEVDAIRRRVKEFLVELDSKFPSRRLLMLNALAEGADHLAAEVAVELGIDLIVPLPMRKEEYLQDFSSQAAIDGFEVLLAKASDSFELQSPEDFRRDSVSIDWSDCEIRYAQLGVYLAAHCHILLALWDGKPSDVPGGTGHIVRFHHDDELPGYMRKTVLSQQMLVDDESDLIFHIVCSRNRDNGEPDPSVEALDSFWFTKDEDQPRSKDLPAQHEAIFRRSGELSSDSMRFEEQIRQANGTLIDPAIADELPPGIRAIDCLFQAADWLAVHFQRRTIMTLRLIHLLAFVMGLMFILYSDLDSWSYYLIVFLLAFAFASVLQFVAKRLDWHRKYLDYRALAEGLRVQFYWAAAGVTNDNASKFIHDSFLQAQDPEVGWIRNVMRVAGLRADASVHKDRNSLEFAVRHWVGDEQTGQLGYFLSKAQNRIQRQRITEMLGKTSLLVSTLVVASLVVFGADMPPARIQLMMVIMGTLLLVYALRHSYATSIAEKELIKQYDFMLRVFRNSRRRIDEAKSADETRQVLLALGGAALDEQAEWLRTHRERVIDRTEIWQMGS